MTTILDKVADEKILAELVQIGIENAKRDFRYWQAIWDRLDGKVATPIDEIDKQSELAGNDFVTITPADDQPGDKPADQVLE